jgi:DnaJ-class molecular chaperone
MEKYECPVCKGDGLITPYPNISDSIIDWVTPSTGVYRCKNCKGTGVVFSKDDVFIIISDEGVFIKNLVKNNT